MQFTDKNTICVFEEPQVEELLLISNQGSLSQKENYSDKNFCASTELSLFKRKDFKYLEKDVNVLNADYLLISSDEAHTHFNSCKDR